MWCLSAAPGRALSAEGAAGGRETPEGTGYVDLEMTRVCSLHPC